MVKPKQTANTEWLRQRVNRMTQQQQRDLIDMSEDDMPRKIRCWRTLRKLEMIRHASATSHYTGWVLTERGKQAAQLAKKTRDGIAKLLQT